MKRLPLMRTYVPPSASPFSGSMPVTLSLVSLLPQAANRATKTARTGRTSDRLAMATTLLQQVAACQRAPHLGQRLLLALTDALAGQVVLVPDLLEGQLLLGPQTEALAQDI